MVYMIYFSLGQKEVILWPCIPKWAGSSLAVEVMACSFFCTKALFNTLRPRLKGRHFADNLLKCIFLYENVWILIKILLNFVPLGPIYNIAALIQIMAWRRPGGKPLSEAMVVTLPRQICVTRPQCWIVINKTLLNIQHDFSTFRSLHSRKCPWIHGRPCDSHLYYPKTSNISPTFVDNAPTTSSFLT